MVTTFSIEKIEQAISVGKSMVESNLIMARDCHLKGDKSLEDKYFTQASKLATKVASLQAQVRIIQYAIN